MAYETLLMLPDGHTLRKTDLEKLTEHSLLYFVKEKRFNILHDFPCMGGIEKRLKFSTIEGPFETPQIIGKQDYFAESSKQMATVLIPASRMPMEFEKISLAEFGTSGDQNSLRFVGQVYHEEINSGAIWNLGNRGLETLKKLVDVEKLSETQYRARVGDCLVEFQLGEAKSYPYPVVQARILGRGEAPMELLSKLDLRELAHLFPGSSLDVGIEHSSQYGLAYDFDTKGESIAEITKKGNVII